MNLKQLIFRELKTHNGQTVDVLAQKLGVKEQTILNEIGILCANGWVEIRNNKVFVRIVLDPIPTYVPMDWQYEQLAKVEVLPQKWMNPLVEYVVHRDQGDRGTCVGQACATWFDLNYVKLTGDLPTIEEVGGVIRNVQLDDGVVVDQLVSQTFSAECVYQKSREIGNVTHPSGSYTPAGLRAMKEYGVCEEVSWPTAKTPYAVYQKPPGNVDDEVTQHRIDGYAGITTFEGIKQAIYECGAVVGSVLVYDNYGRMEGGDGTFPSPTVSVIGSHALCWVGYDENNLYCLHSWGDWCGRIGKMSREYFNTAQVGFYTVLDEYEVTVAREKYVKLVIKCNVDASVWIDGKFVGKGKVVSSVLVGRYYSVRVEYDGKDTCDIVHVDGDRELVYDFPTKSWVSRLLEWLVRLLR